MYTAVEAEGRRLKNPFDTITEGVGINRLTANFDKALVDGAFQGERTHCSALHMDGCMRAAHGYGCGRMCAWARVGAWVAGYGGLCLNTVYQIT